MDTEASNSLASWELKGKGMHLKGWSSVAWARPPKENFKDFSWPLLTRSSPSSFPQRHKMNFENLCHQSFTKDHQTFLVPHNLRGGREGIEQGISSSSSISGNYSKTVLPHTNVPATQTEMSSCPNMEEVSPGIAIELTAEEHNCFSCTHQHPSISMPRTLTNLVQNWQRWVRSLSKANS